MAKLPFNENKLSQQDKQLYDAMVAARKKLGSPFGGPYAALMNHPQLCQKINSLGSYLKFEGHLSRDVYQFVVLSVARYTDAAFEWVDHLEHAKAAGVPVAVIQTLQKHGVGQGDYPAPYKLAADILAVTLVWKDIPEALQQQAITAYGMYGFVEIVVLSGFYQMFSAINQGFDVSLDAGAVTPW